MCECMQHMHPLRLEYSFGAQVQSSELELIHTENQIFSNVCSEHKSGQRVKCSGNNNRGTVKEEKRNNKRN